MTEEKSYSYEQAGVSIAAGNALVKAIAPLAKSTARPGADAELGGFGGFFDPKAAGYKDPLLVAANDGVGTKVKLAIDHDRHDGIGIDLVAMCVNDAICCGAEPLFFLDYVAMAADDPGLLEQIVSGISQGCLDCDAALVGGETAIMPDLYQPGDYDLAGFCVGIVEQSRMLTGVNATPGDAVIGIASSGIHSNGYSLVRKIVLDHAGLKVNDKVDFSDQTVGDVLLTPTRLYTRPVRDVLNHYKVKSVVHGSPTSPGAGCMRTSPACCRTTSTPRFSATVGRSRRCSSGCRSWGTSRTTRCSSSC